MRQSAGEHPVEETTTLSSPSRGHRCERRRLCTASVECQWVVVVKEFDSCLRVRPFAMLQGSSKVYTV